MYVYATYSSSDKVGSSVRDSQAVIWDTILSAEPSPYRWDAVKEKVTAVLPASITGSKVKRVKKAVPKKVKAGEPSHGVLRLRGHKAKYQISDITGRLAERQNVTLSVGWNVQPWVGALWWSPKTGAVPHTAGTVLQSETFDFPELKGKKPEGQAKP